ncbi:MAG: GSCFA family protein [Rhodobacteraceae bacterium]|nr:MAG: GSCFA family protein [Paracoccaceae bacterium]
MNQPARAAATTPYTSLPSRAFWRSAVAEAGHEGFSELWKPKFGFGTDEPIATFGSCFAQHIGPALKRAGFAWLLCEKPPRTTPEELARAHGYGLFSARTGNIYTPTLLLQWLEWALERRVPPTEVWIEGNGLRDPFRPRLEPAPFESEKEIEKLRNVTLRALRKCVGEARVLIFTLGLTERWIHAARGYEYPLCPGTAAGQFDPSVHRAAPLDFNEALRAMRKALDLMRSVNPELRFVLTVSPVPLSATASGAHVLTATTGAKAVLRAVAGQLAETRRDTEYFPSYELITSPVTGGRFFAADHRSVTPAGVASVMEHFFAGLGLDPDAVTKRAKPARKHRIREAEAVVCDEELLSAFGPR